MASALETLCGQAYGRKKYYMLGVYMQRSWIVLFICCILLVPLYVFATPVSAGGISCPGRRGGGVDDPSSLQLCVPVPAAELKFGVVGTTAIVNFSWWILTFGLFGYTVLGGCPNTWTGFSSEAFVGLWEFVKLSAASGLMLCLENWYYRILILMTGNLPNAEIAVDALSI
ncbi:hypothetical protein PIB30_082325, partial [Stylosanthes scabra]|nr:hypothetical protein [Stylosanthes scabra]